MDIDVSGCALSGSDCALSGSDCALSRNDCALSGGGCALPEISLLNNSSTAAMARHSESSSVQSARAPFTINYERETLVSTHRWIYKSLGCCQGCEGTRAVYICRMYSMRQR